MIETAKIVKQYREDNDLSLRKFADEINQRLINTGVTYATVSRWEDNYEPDMRLLFEMVATYHDWRARFAVDCLKAMWPDLTQSGTIVFNLPLPKRIHNSAANQA